MDSGPGRLQVSSLKNLKIKIFADGAAKAEMTALYQNPHVQGFTTNPTLMRKAGIANYKDFALEILQAIPDRSISFEVFADEFADMERQARQITTWGKNVYVKIPIMNTNRESALPLIKKLAEEDIKLNITAVMTLEQVRGVSQAIAKGPSCYVSVFAGRIADTGRDPLPVMVEALKILKPCREAELLWASPREILNVFQADEIGCHIITVSHDILQKLSVIGKDLDEFSLETVKMFYEDGKKAGYKI
jgi:transaldolase